MARPRGVGKYEKMQKKAKKPKKLDSAYSFYRGRATAWCYRCDSEHRWEEDCYER